MNKEFEERAVKNYEVVSALENLIRKENREGLQTIIDLFNLETTVEDLMATETRRDVEEIVLNN